MVTNQEKINELEEERRGHKVNLAGPGISEAERIAILGAIAAIDNRLASLTTQQGMFPLPVSVVFPYSLR